ncbi:acetyl-CoA synthetase-like protein [Hesseltinella vesiculosa]|uniref:Acetyl-CoA synthetase-like protein n=1 Tax=Hesseltinella vesiculosa TaxID=101127 RepID=A0A1X2GHT4_9FUNG|nr:acetyl-CoA synthetase-like protein [Hesseltinella vesiculosa]
MENKYYSFVQFLNEKTIQYSDNVFIKLINADGDLVESYTFGQIAHASKALALKLIPTIRNLNAHPTETRPVVSIIADHDLSLLVWMFALYWLKVTIMCISPRNSPPAVEHLLTKASSSLVLCTAKYRSMAENVSQLLHECQVLTMYPLDILALADTSLDEGLLPVPMPSDYEEILLIIHSSGSTSFPKPILLSDRYIYHTSKVFPSVLGQYNAAYGSDDVFLSCMPLFHVAGNFGMLTAMQTGCSVIFHQAFPPSVDTIFKTVQRQKVSRGIVAPITVEHMVERLRDPACPLVWKDPASFNTLRQLFFGGAPLKDSIADYLVANLKLNLVSSYGTTGTAPFTRKDTGSFFFLSNANNYNGLKPLSFAEKFTIWEDAQMQTSDGAKLYRLVVKGDCPTLATGIINRDDGNHDTNDLFYKSIFPGYYKYSGRQDDMIVLANGEKTNPLPMESAFRESPIIEQAVVCGADRPATLALIQLNIEEAFKHTPNEIIELVHEAARKVNESCPNHAKVLKQLIYILPFQHCMECTDKGTAKRKAIMAQYAEIIDQMYEEFSQGASSTANNEKLDGKSMSPETLKKHLIQAAAAVLEKPALLIELHTSQSLFDFGLSSLLVTQLRKHLLNWFDDVPLNLVYQCPSIDDLVRALLSLSKNNEPCGFKATRQLTQHYIDLAKKDFEAVKATYAEGTEPVYLLTGVTGSIGSFTLEDLLTRNKNTKVYCLVRAKTPAAATERLAKAFHDRQLNTELLHQALANKNVQAFPMNLDDDMLGFSEQQFNQLKSEITIILHIAWLLDFNQPLEHFDRTCIQGMYRLLKFAYRGPSRPAMHIHTLSSVSATSTWKPGFKTSDGHVIIPETVLPDDPSQCSMPMGYAESKYVIERLFNYLATERNFPAVVERVGQICGDSRHGVWNYSEQYPLMIVGGAGIMHKMPNLDMIVDWLPVDYAARCINEIVTALWEKETSGPPTPPDEHRHIRGPFHIVNPRRTSWNAMLETLRECGLQFETVSMSEWTEALAIDEANPAHRLLSFYQNSETNLPMPIFSTKNTCLIAPSVTESPPINDKGLLLKFLTHWRQVSQLSF